MDFASLTHAIGLLSQCKVAFILQYIAPYYGSSCCSIDSDTNEEFYYKNVMDIVLIEREQLSN